MSKGADHRAIGLDITTSSMAKITLGSQLADRYKITKKLSVGGFGKTFLARDLQRKDKRRCIVKQFNPNTQDEFTVNTGRRLFRNEVRVLKRLGENDQVPELFDSFEENDEFYLVEEFVDGHSLKQELRWGRRWNERQVVAFLKDILSTLAMLHLNNVIHRDLKPGNLIRRRADNKIVLIDFGAVKQPSTFGSSKTVVVGTPGYMPGEQSSGRPRFCSDVYAVGMIAVQALTGRNPNDRQLPENPKTGEINWQRYTSVSPALAEVIDTMVRYDFRQRYPTALQALEAVNALPPPSFLKWPRLRLGVSLLGVGLAGTGAMYYALQHGFTWENLQQLDWETLQQLDLESLVNSVLASKLL